MFTNPLCPRRIPSLVRKPLYSGNVCCLLAHLRSELTNSFEIQRVCVTRSFTSLICSSVCELIIDAALFLQWVRQQALAQLIQFFINNPPTFWATESLLNCYTATPPLYFMRSTQPCTHFCTQCRQCSSAAQLRSTPLQNAGYLPACQPFMNRLLTPTEPLTLLLLELPSSQPLFGCLA